MLLGSANGHLQCLPNQFQKIHTAAACRQQKLVARKKWRFIAAWKKRGNDVKVSCLRWRVLAFPCRNFWRHSRAFSTPQRVVIYALIPSLCGLLSAACLNHWNCLRWHRYRVFSWPNGRSRILKHWSHELLKMHSWIYPAKMRKTCQTMEKNMCFHVNSCKFLSQKAFLTG